MEPDERRHPPPAPPQAAGRAADPGQRRQKVLWPVITAVSLVLALAAAARFIPGSPLAAGAPDTSATAGTTLAGTTPAGAIPTVAPSPTPPPLPPLRFRSAPLTVTTEGFFSWALMDRRTGEIWGSASMERTTWPASMIKAWLASDDLRRLAHAGKEPSEARLHELEAMIRDSDNNAAQSAYVRNGGIASIKRLISRAR